MASEPLYELRRTLKDYTGSGHSSQVDLMTRKGVSDNMYDEQKYGDADKLKEYVSDMLAIRNGNLAKTKKYCSQHVGTTCSGHSYSNYQQLMKKVTGMTNPISHGDIYKSIPQITYCTCNSRYGADCLCQNNLVMDHCQCNNRTIPSKCDCRTRDRGKYDPESVRCICDGRHITICFCLGRTATNDCSCNSRCSCDMRKEFSYSKHDNNCVCNTKSIPGCTCDTLRMNRCIYHFCNCFARSAKTITTGSGNHTTYTPSYCDINVNESHSFGNYCACKARCSCDGRKVLKGESSYLYSVPYTHCECNQRDICVCHSRKGAPQNIYVEEEDSEGGTYTRCTCYNRTAVPVCDCHQRDICVCHYRTNTSQVTYTYSNSILNSANQP